MFTGIVQAVGRVFEIAPRGEGALLRVEANHWAYAPEAGDSIAVSGVCLTVTRAVSRDHFDATFDVVRETLSRTTLGAMTAGSAVNLEPSLQPTTLISGHFVQGHIDGVGHIESVHEADRDTRIRVALPSGLGALCPEKGSIAIDGVSLTIAASAANEIEIALVPETLARTTLGAIRASDNCNIEIDCLTRAAAHYIDAR